MLQHFAEAHTRMKQRLHPLLSLGLLLLLACPLSAQQVDVFNLRISGTYQDRPLPELLTDLEARYPPLRFYYVPEKIPFYQLTITFQDEPFFQVVKKLLDGSLLSAGKWSATEVILVPEDNRNRAFVQEMVNKWKTGEYKPPVLTGVLEKSYSFGSIEKAPNGKVTLKGKIVDGESKEPIIGATVLVRETAQGQASDENGDFELKIPAGRYTLQVQYVSFQSQIINVSLFDDGNLDINLAPMPQQLSEVLIKAQAVEKGSQSSNVGVERLSIRTVKELPTLMGEADVIKSLQTLPGVTNAGEGVAGYNVRGGNIDQNLVLQEEAPIFNSAHALGFFSIFNADAVDQINLYKGHIPAQYGGRLSSVLDVQLKDGDARKWSGKGSIGPIASRILLEGPIKTDKISALIGLRQSYMGWVLQLTSSIPVQNSAAGFNDGIAKVTFNLSPKDKLRLTGFASSDDFRYGQDFGYGWNNYQAGAQWSHITNEKLSSKLYVNYGAYRAEQFDPEGNNAFSLTNGLNFWKSKLDNLYALNKKQALRFGAEINHYQSRPEAIRPFSDISIILPQSVDKDKGREMAVYFQDEITLSKRISFSLGARYSFFQQLGPRTVWNYEESLPREDLNIVDSINFGGGKAIANYGGFEPRFSAKFGISDRASFKVSYNRLRQYIHLTSNTVAPTPVDVWQVSTTYIPPQIADQYSAGFFLDDDQRRWEASIEVYYKDIRNLLEYKDLPDLLLNPRIETELLAGRGKAYGTELSIRKMQGKWTGWITYTFARTFSRVQGPSPSETINRGEWFPANFDKPNQVNVIGRAQINPTNSFSFNFTYSTGRPITAPISSYRLGTVLVPNFSDRNQYRIPDYHRLDISYTIDNRQTRLKGWRGSLTVSLYNVYARANPFSVFFQRNERGRPSAYQLAVVGSVIPAVSYNFSF
jgi:hypothetical protein